jgi:hypothetical protein
VEGNVCLVLGFVEAKLAFGSPGLVVGFVSAFLSQIALLEPGTSMLVRDSEFPKVCKPLKLLLLLDSISLAFISAAPVW